MTELETTGELSLERLEDVHGGEDDMGVQTFDDGSTLQTFDDGSTLATDTEGNYSSSPATDTYADTANYDTPTTTPDTGSYDAPVNNNYGTGDPGSFDAGTRSIGTPTDLGSFDTVQRFDDGTTLQRFDDGSTLARDTDGNFTSTPATDWSPTGLSAEPLTAATIGAAPGGGPTDADILKTRIDIAQNYEDGASPPRLQQGSLEDCFVVGSLNEVAKTPEGQAHLASRIENLGDGFYQVKINDPHGAPQNVIVREPPGGFGATGDQNLRIFEKAIATTHTPDLGGLTEREVYSNINHGGWPGGVMQQLGLENPYGPKPAEYDPKDAIRIYDANGGSLSGNTMTLNTLKDPVNPYGLVGPHAYEVAMTYRDPTTSESMVVLKNPHGFNHPQPIPERDLGTYFSTFSYGRLPR